MANTLNFDYAIGCTGRWNQSNSVFEIVVKKKRVFEISLHVDMPLLAYIPYVSLLVTF